MDFIYRTPFFRFIIPLIGGIISFKYFEIFSWSLVSILAFSLFCLALSFFIKNSKLQFQTRWLYGAGVFLFLYVAGYYLSERREQSNLFENLNSEIIVESEITEAPFIKEKSVLCRIKTIRKFENQKPLFTNGKALVYIQKDSLSESLQTGDILLIEADFRKPDGVINPDGFDYRTYLKRQGIGATAYIQSGSWKKVAENSSFSIFRLAEKWQKKLLNVYKKFGIEGDEFAVLAALTLGSKDALYPELRQNYVTSGGMHILAVSGLHVGIIYMVLGFIFSLVIKNPRYKLFKSILIIILLWLYAFITGLPPSVIRSTLMFSMIALGSGLDRKSLIYNTIFASAFIMLLVNTDFLYDVGFQLSYAAVLSIVYFQPKISKWIYVKNPVLKWLWDLFSVSLAAQIGTAPLAVYYFHQFANYFILTNFVAIPFAIGIIYLAIALFVFSSVPYIPVAIAFILQYLLKGLNYSILFIHDLPYSATFLAISSFQVFLLISFVVLLAVYFESKKYPALLSAVVLMLAFVIINLKVNYDSTLEDKLIVYADNKNTHVDFINGKEHYVYTSDISSIDNVAGSYWLNKKLTTPYDVCAQDWYCDGFMEFKGKKICILNDSILQNKIAVNKLNIDILIIGNNMKPNINRILDCIQPAQIIVDKSISPWYTNNIRLKCVEQKVRFYSVAEKGAYVSEIKD